MDSITENEGHKKSSVPPSSPLVEASTTFRGGFSSCSSLADNLPSSKSNSSGRWVLVTPESFKQTVFKEFGGYREFWKKVGIYLKVITNDSCRFRVEEFSKYFLVLKICSPCSYRKGIELSKLAQFFNIESKVIEKPFWFRGGGNIAEGDGAVPRTATADRSKGGGEDGG